MAFIAQGMCASSVKFNQTWCIIKLRPARLTPSGRNADKPITQVFLWAGSSPNFLPAAFVVARTPSGGWRRWLRCPYDLKKSTVFSMPSSSVTWGFQPRTRAALLQSK